MRTYSQAKLMAYQLIQPIECGMSGFAEKLGNRPEWQEVVALLVEERDEAAHEKAAIIIANHWNN